MAEDLSIRWYEYGVDLEAITAIDTKNYEEYWSVEDFKKKLRQKTTTCLVAEVNKKVIGFLIYELFLQRFSILRIAIDPFHRRKGYGSQLLNELAGKLTPGKRVTIEAEVRETNLPVQLFLKKNGYRATEVFRNHYPDNGEDCFLFHYRMITS